MTDVYFDTQAVFAGSTAISNAWYDKHLNKLYVRFTSGSFAGYYASESIWERFTYAASAGRFFQDYIKGTLQGFSVPDDANFMRRPSSLADDELARAKPAKDTDQWLVNASISFPDIEITVVGDTLDDAIASFKRRVQEAFGSEEVHIDFRSVSKK